MKNTSTLLATIHAPEILVMPAAYDAVSARLIQEAGFKAVQCSGLGIAASRYGVPDVSVVSMAEMAEATRVIASAVDIPVMGDGDTGYGNVVNTWYTVRRFEAAGAAGINLEDQVLPKRCGRLAGKDVVPIDEMVDKIRAAVDARTDPDFVINARTDSLSLKGIDEVVARGNAFMAAGATMFFVEGFTSRDEIKRVVDAVDGPIAMNLMEEGGPHSLSDITLDELQELGIARVSLSVTTLLGAVLGVRSALSRFQDLRRAAFDPKFHAPFLDLHALAGMPKAEEIGQRFGS